MAEELKLEAAAGGTRLRVRVQPRASRATLVGVAGGVLRVAVTAPPVDGAANAAVVALLAEACGVRRREVEIAGGHTGRDKVILVRGLEPEAVRARLEGHLHGR